MKALFRASRIAGRFFAMRMCQYNTMKALVFCVVFALLASPGAPLGAETLDAIRKAVPQSPQRAMERLDVYLKENPGDAQGWFLKGLMLADRNRRDEAIGVFTALTQNFPELPEPYNNLGVLHAANGEIEKARLAFERALLANPEYTAAHENLADVYLRMAADGYAKAGDRPSAKTKLDRVREILGQR